MTRRGKTEKRYAFLFFVTGFLGLSSFGSYLFNLINFPIYLPELFFLPFFIVFLKGKIKIYRFTPCVLFLLFCELFSVVVGIINTGDPFNIITCIRPLFYFTLICYSMGQTGRYLPLGYVFLMCVGSQVGEIVNKLLTYASFSSVDHINWVTLCVMVLIPVVQKKRAMTIASALFGISCAFFSLYRRILLFLIVALLIAYLYYIVKSYSIKKLLALLVGFLGLFVLLQNSETMTLAIAKFLGLDTSFIQYRFIEKSQSIVTGQLSFSDTDRMNIYSELITTFREKMMMIGPVGKAVDINRYFGKYTDVPMIFLYDVFGSILAWPIVLIMLINGCKCSVKVFAMKTTNEMFILSGLMAPIVILSMLIDGAFLVHFPYAVSAGYIVSCWGGKTLFLREKNE